VVDMGLNSILGEPKEYPIDQLIWLAPERLKNQKATTASDVYAFGMILYHIAAQY